MKALEILIVLYVAVLVSLLGIILFGDFEHHEANKLRAEAVQRGYAEWKVTPEGKTIFTWR